MGDWSTINGALSNTVSAVNSIAASVQAENQLGTSPNIQFSANTNWTTLILIAVIVWIALKAAK